MASSKLPAPSRSLLHDQRSSSTHTGEVVESLIELVERIERQNSISADEADDDIVIDIRTRTAVATSRK